MDESMATHEITLEEFMDSIVEFTVRQVNTTQSNEKCMEDVAYILDDIFAEIYNRIQDKLPQPTADKDLW